MDSKTSTVNIREMRVGSVHSTMHGLKAKRTVGRSVEWRGSTTLHNVGNCYHMRILGLGGGRLLADAWWK